MSREPWESDEALKASLQGVHVTRTTGQEHTTWLNALHATVGRKRGSVTGMVTTHRSMAQVVNDPLGLGSVDRLGMSNK